MRRAPPSPAIVDTIRLSRRACLSGGRKRSRASRKYRLLRPCPPRPRAGTPSSTPPPAFAVAPAASARPAYSLQSAPRRLAGRAVPDTSCLTGRSPLSHVQPGQRGERGQRVPVRRSASSSSAAVSSLATLRAAAIRAVSASFSYFFCSSNARESASRAPVSSMPQTFRSASARARRVFSPSRKTDQIPAGRGVLRHPCALLAAFHLQAVQHQFDDSLAVGDLAQAFSAASRPPGWRA